MLTGTNFQHKPVSTLHISVICNYNVKYCHNTVKLMQIMKRKLECLYIRSAYMVNVFLLHKGR